MERKYVINPKDEKISVKILIENIDKGYNLQELEGELNDEDKLDYNGAIIIAPDYQREYRFKLDDEIKLIESVFLGIPIPPIFFATDKFKEVRVRNVVDGQHRLRALHRFYNGEFKLDNLELLPELNGCYFNDLDLDLKGDYLEARIDTITFSDFPGLEFEMEIFSRYNKGTKPLSAQEIRHAAYNSNFNIYVNEFSYQLYKTKLPRELFNAYNISKDRIQKKKLQEGIFVILNILEYGINEKYEKSLDYAEEYMKEKKQNEKNNPYEADKNYKTMIKVFEDFNHFITRLCSKIKFPFSKELYGISSRNYKFQISIAMILAGLFKEKFYNQDYLQIILYDDGELDYFLEEIKKILLNSFLENSEYNSSTTNSHRIKELIDTLKSCNLHKS